MRADQIMTQRPVTVRAGSSVLHAAQMMRDYDIGAVPVVADTSGAAPLLGIITDRDIVVRCTAREHLPSCPVSEHMTPAPLQTVRPTDDVSVVIAKMESAQVRRIPVVAEDGTLVGMIAQADVVMKVGASAPKEVDELLAQISASAPALA